MKLSDLPTVTIERIQSTERGLEYLGRIEKLDGVAREGCFRLERGRYAWATLEVVDRQSGVVKFTDVRGPSVASLSVGVRYIWLGDYWQMPLVEAIADESTVWRRFVFKCSDARRFRLGDAVGWQPTDQPLPDGAEDLGVSADGWDHEHCGLCGNHIDAGNPVGYTDDGKQFLCERCFLKYGATHDVSFQLDL